MNVSPAQLRDGAFAGEVAHALGRHGLAPRRLLLEVTESVAARSDPQTQASLDALHALGVRLALDDFGAGTSSLSLLTRLGVHLVKLDASLLADVDEDEERARLVRGVLQLARSLGVPVVAEGIERPAQLARVQELGGTLGQGYLLGAPMRAEELARRLGADGARTGPVSLALGA